MMAFRTLRSKCALLAAVCLSIVGAARHASADIISLEWDPSGTSSVGYRIHVGTTPGSYSQHFDVGSATMFAFSSAVAGQRYCFAVSAYLLSSQLEGPNSAEVCGFSNAPPTLRNPGNLTSTVGQPVTLQLVGSDPQSQPLTYSATGLPAGLSLMASTGFISGTGTTAGTYNVTARANDGTLTATQQFTWVMNAATGGGDTTRPVATITSPTSNTSYTSTGATLNLGGTATDNVAVTQVRWANDRGGSGTANGTSNWSVSGIQLQSGTNVITVTAFDAAGNSGIDTLTVTYSATGGGDTTRPVATITSPTSNTSYTANGATMSLGGTATDNVGVTQVRWSNDRGGNGVASGTSSWSVSGIALQGGRNVITVTARDAAGNEATDTLTVTYTAPTQPPPPSTFTLTAELRGSRWRTVFLMWSGVSSRSVDVYRNGVRIGSTRNDGYATDNLNRSGRYEYRVCAAGSRTSCSNTVSVSY